MAHCATVKIISIGRRVYVKKAVKAAAVPGLSAEPFETRFISPETIVPASRFTDSHRLCWSESAMMLARAHWKGFIRHCGKPAPGFFKRNRTAGRRPFAPAPGHGAGLTVHDHHLQRHAQRRAKPWRTMPRCRRGEQRRNVDRRALNRRTQWASFPKHGCRVGTFCAAAKS